MLEIFSKRTPGISKKEMLAKSMSVVVSTFTLKQAQLASMEDGGILESFNGCVSNEKRKVICDLPSKLCVCVGCLGGETLHNHSVNNALILF